MIPHAKDFGYSQQWNFAIQHKFAGAFSAEIAYVGTKGTRLQTSSGDQRATPGAGRCSARRPYPDFGAITWNEQSASSIYHALQDKGGAPLLQRTFALASYTWSKNIDQDSDNTEGDYDPYNFRLNRGLSSFDVPHVFTSGLCTNLPWLRKAHGPRAPAWRLDVRNRDYLPGGFPYTPGFSGDPSNTGTGSRADVVAGCDAVISNPTPSQMVQHKLLCGAPGPLRLPARKCGPPYPARRRLSECGSLACIRIS